MTSSGVSGGTFFLSEPLRPGAEDAEDAEGTCFLRRKCAERGGGGNGVKKPAYEEVSQSKFGEGWGRLLIKGLHGLPTFKIPNAKFQSVLVDPIAASKRPSTEASSKASALLSLLSLLIWLVCSVCSMNETDAVFVLNRPPQVEPWLRCTSPRRGTPTSSDLRTAFRANGGRLL